MSGKLITSYAPQPVTFTHGEGVWLFDTNNNKYLDGLSGIAVSSLGHAHPAIVNAIKSQAEKLLHTSNIYHIEHQEALAEKLTKITGMEQIFFSNSGAEANEAAIKLARLYGHKKGINTPTIIVMEKAFHGRTMATLTASANRKGQAGFEPLVPGFVRAPFNDIEALETIAHNREDVVAIMLEPIQGEGGINPPDSDYLNKVRALCDEHHWLMIVDEIQTGMARTGKLYSFMHNGITPDILTTAKALGNGVPIAACLMHGPACDLFEPGNHGSTFGGNPLATKTALTVLEIIEKEKLCEAAATKGQYLKDKIIEALSDNPHFIEVRGHGLMLGIVLDRPCKPLVSEGIKNGVLFNVTAETVIRLLPPLIITDDEIDELVKRLKTTIENSTIFVDENGA